MTSKHAHTSMGLKSWFSRSQWDERIVTFDPSWFVVTMGTGIIVQLLNYFPWQAQWLKNLGYVFWILDIVLIAFFTILSCLRLFFYRRIALSVLDDFSQTAYLGAIPISFDTVATGLALYYNHNTSAMYAAEALYWINVAMTVAVSLGGVFIMYKCQGQHKLEEVTGVWLLAFIPMIVTAALGSTLIPYLLGNNAATILVVSFLMLSLGIGLSFIITTIYFWRLMACSLPARDAIVSCFVPVGPFGMSAFTILGLSLDLSRFVTTQGFVFEETWIPPFNETSQAAIGQMIIWIGIISAFMLLGIATFFLVEAFTSVFSRIPKTFNIGFWSFVFPCGVYANAFCRLGTTLRNRGINGFAAACVVCTILLWLMCALITTYKGVWQGKTFVAPGLQGYVEQRELENLREKPSSSQSATTPTGGTASKEQERSQTAERNVSSDGTYRRHPLHRKSDVATNV